MLIGLHRGTYEPAKPARYPYQRKSFARFPLHRVSHGEVFAAHTARNCEPFLRMIWKLFEVLRRLVLPSTSIGAGLRFLSVGARWPRGRGRLFALVERVQSARLVVMVGHAVVVA